MLYLPILILKKNQHIQGWMKCCVGGGEGRGYLRSTWVQMFAALVMLSVNVQLCANVASSSRGTTGVLFQ